ncbi:alcohol dehydrogenase catalytic domain-containing protein [Streptacidiphilus anmyonensis]|uniref:alcohol dehydrogenase catalytic domain-containing protein n=1 Tax=Streptacidiphilus anmyonensis TaxID=405782 RepID=UPI000693DA7E|nr:alcohol dehydrogenase catalytic domain-containing protein [Streptacidiphilus anmyonensis]
MGHDFAGVVEAVGAGVTRLKAGDAVLGRARFRQAGAFAEMVTAPETAVVHKPAELSYEQAAALPTVGVTAYQATAEIRPGQAVFVNGCLGGVGRRRPVRPGAGSLSEGTLGARRGRQPGSPGTTRPDS